MGFWNKLKKSLEKAATYASYAASFGLAYINDRETKKIRNYALENAELSNDLNYYTIQNMAPNIPCFDYSYYYNRKLGIRPEKVKVSVRKVEDLMSVVRYGDLYELNEIIKSFEDRGVNTIFKEIKIGEYTESYKRFAYGEIYEALKKRYEDLKRHSKKHRLSDFESDLISRLYNVIEEFYWSVYLPSFR